MSGVGIPTLIFLHGKLTVGTRGTRTEWKVAAVLRLLNHGNHGKPALDSYPRPQSRTKVPFRLRADCEVHVGRTIRQSCPIARHLPLSMPKVYQSRSVEWESQGRAALIRMDATIISGPMTAVAEADPIVTRLYGRDNPGSCSCLCPCLCLCLCLPSPSTQ